MIEAININITPSLHQFRVTLTPQIKDFSASSKKSGLGTWILEFDNAHQFPSMVWQKASPHIVRGVSITDNAGHISCSWMEGNPTIDQIHLFVEIYDEAAKRAAAWDKIDGAKIQSFATRDVRVVVYRYSKNIVSKDNFEFVKRSLINNTATDRSGAATISEEDSLRDRLMQLYGGTFTGTSHMSWSLWANSILSKPAVAREDLIQAGPPLQMLHLFRSTNVPAEVVLSNLFEANRTSLDMIDRLKRDSNRVREALDFLYHGLSIYENQFQARSHMHNAPTETADSVELLAHVANQVDYDHMDVASVTSPNDSKSDD